ncbi:MULTISPECIES: bifunctional hydroxymethylpyrimidine kinase/phosphomethylpyrimidine kinase [Cyanophyceae]|uniref:bifunctional hydroxymethylpyrimidine kinase/phosphomethylpyrimidine kinase n=2 Tax=Cyanophyceae TaxID=3028117 RepID=UPI00168A16D6|nr:MULTISPECIES: bifunctional hydroxymethylpyrimidine kinase/phosphomethylpyrimidine kinase [Cyanophyceae]MBD1916844.1 bifunctional hydroxymethylpyrimidine kinase/phosphomethylpyrimidine kinase [Phormidium sp. FACHB-77]MBD2029475.1 bifunctional hydroxymethylpyrimidine kinase/phosphomethylpyrimidine kinase [Phormidium sp. FACHB-322]MBD2052051.1 bifunctional hydroxymethylpyrimidine kinase/phosphomethylpyrimidine kinase [Leptolyngbya sp. FACHB-60]
MTMSPTWPAALTIAGSDSGGGAGIQADLRTFAFHLVHGTSALTCVTAQNTLGVTRVDPLPPEAVIAQIEAVTSDIAVQGVKTGMLLNQGIIQAVAEALGSLPHATPVVVDPVMVSRTGAQLIDDDAIATLTRHLIPQAHVLTPNRYEAQLLSGLAIATLADMEAAARQIHQLGPQAVLVKGGGMMDDLRSTDVWFDGREVVILEAEVVETRHTHGTGCTLSAAIAANLALGKDPLSAVKAAKDYVTNALRHALAIGQGQGPVGHFFPLLNK